MAEKDYEKRDVFVKQNGDSIMKKKDITALFIIFIVAALLLSVFTVFAYYGNQGFHFEINSIIAYESMDNENIVRYEIKGKVNTWIFDNNQYENVYLQGEECGGEIRCFNTSAKSDVINISHKKSDFTIIFDIDKTSYNWSDSDEEYIFQERFWLRDADGELYSDLSYILDMSRFSHITIAWQEPRKIDDCLLKIENWQEYAEIHGDQYIDNYDDTVY